MKLELKHLAPYLPYNLKIKWVDKKLKWVDKYDIWNIGFNSDVDFNFMRYPLSTLIYTIDMGNELSWKPILRPLSDLTKEIEHNGERFVPMDKFSILYFGGQSNKNLLKKDFYENIIYTPYKDLSFRTVEKLFKWHFDVFGLIDAGLAVDVNKVEQSK